MNCARPTDFNFSFRGFARRGGETDKHEHGWGIAVFEGRGLRTFLDPLPAANSPVAELVERYPMKTLNMMAHIRYATQGAVELENVHPFQREMWGIQWCFCHNGEVPKYTGQAPDEMPLLGRTQLGQQTFHPVGDTDSEAVFCALLNALRAEFDTLPSLPVLFETLQRFCCEIVSGYEDSTIFNFLLGVGQYTLFAYSWPGSRPGSTVWNGLFYTIRSPPFHKATLSDVDYAVNFADVTTPNDRVAVIATKPLTVDEKWTEFRKGQLLMFDCGHPYSELYDCDEVERSGRGLCSRVLRKKGTDEEMDERRRSISYNAPSLLRAMVDAVVKDADFAGGAASKDDAVWARRGVDLGCGCGLSGAAFRSAVAHLTGVDLSREMLDKARERGCHDELVVGDIETALIRCGGGRRGCGGGADPEAKEEKTPDGAARTFDLVVACDVFVYVGDLRSVFQSVRDALEPGRGMFAFSAEFLEDDNDDNNGGDGANEAVNSPGEPSSEETKTPEDGKRRPFVLQACARYAHERSYVEALAADCGFEVRAMETSVIRTYEGREVRGALVVMSLPR